MKKHESVSRTNKPVVSASLVMECSQKAVQRMCKSLCRFEIPDTLSDLNERQFEFCLARTLAECTGMEPFLDYRYPCGGGRTDILLWQPHVEYDGGECLWIETKFSADDRPQLWTSKDGWFWEPDLRKLRLLWSEEEHPWDAFHHGYWVWLCVTQADRYPRAGLVHRRLRQCSGAICGKSGRTPRPIEWNRVNRTSLTSYYPQFKDEPRECFDWQPVTTAFLELKVTASCFPLRSGETPLYVHLAVARLG